MVEKQVERLVEAVQEIRINIAILQQRVSGLQKELADEQKSREELRKSVRWAVGIVFAGFAGAFVKWIIDGGLSGVN